MDRNDTKKLAQSLFGRQKAPGFQTEETGKILPIRSRIEELLKLDDESFGFYAWSREPLERKFSMEQKRNYIQRATECGIEEARWLKTEYGAGEPDVIAKKLGLKVETPEMPVGGGHVIFAQYVEPDEITIFMDAVNRAELLMEKQGLGDLFPNLPVYQLLLAHEIFHAVEYRNRDSIFTRTEKIELWRKPFSNRSEIIALSEIAGMAFARELLGLSFSPYMFDVLLMYGYHEEAATAIYEEIKEIAAATA